jgi:hypothetical protein
VKENVPRVRGGLHMMVWWGASHQGVTPLHFALVPKCIKRMRHKEL